jgi:hypothetical protein
MLIEIKMTKKSKCTSRDESAAKFGHNRDRPDRHLLSKIFVTFRNEIASQFSRQAQKFTFPASQDSSARVEESSAYAKRAIASQDSREALKFIFLMSQDSSARIEESSARTGAAMICTDLRARSLSYAKWM